VPGFDIPCLVFFLNLVQKYFAISKISVPVHRLGTPCLFFLV
jgi:hypothetical protein